MLSNKSFNDDKGSFRFIDVLTADVTEQKASLIEVVSTYTK